MIIDEQGERNLFGPVRVDKDERGLLKGLSVKRFERQRKIISKETNRTHPPSSIVLFRNFLIVLCHFLLSFDLKRLGKGRYSRRGNDELPEPSGVQKLVPPNVNYSHCKGWQSGDDSQIIFFHSSQLGHWVAIMESEVLFKLVLGSKALEETTEWKWNREAVPSFRSTCEFWFVAFLFHSLFFWMINNWSSIWKRNCKEE